MKVYIETYGCSASQSSSEIMMGMVAKSGHTLVDEKEAEVIVLNTCTVKATTEQKIFHRIQTLGHRDIELIVTGCMPQVQLEAIMERNPNAHILGINAISSLADLLDTLENGTFDDPALFPDDPEGFLNKPRLRLNPNIHICQISQGCNNRCSYCIVTLARGALQSFEPESIVSDIRMAVNEGCSEIWLTSQDNAQYGIDNKKEKLPELLKKITLIPGDFKVRVGMMNPSSVIAILDDLLDAFESDKIYKLLHLPIQSASDQILKDMRRNYTIAEANLIIETFRIRYPDLTLFTDIIVGFPGETDEDHQSNIEWVKKLKPDKVNISRYTPRPFTKAIQLRNLDTRIVVERSNQLHRICEEIKIGCKKKMIGWKGKVLISKDARIKGFMARTPSYKPVVIPKGDISPGDNCIVQIYDTTAGYFLGRLTEK